MDANGSVGKNYSYDAFGNTTVSGGSSVNSNLRFASGYHEPAPHNLYQFGTRSYDPTIGRWTQQDPLPGSINAGQVDPYVYADNDPTDAVDPSGLSVILPPHAVLCTKASYRAKHRRSCPPPNFNFEKCLQAIKGHPGTDEYNSWREVVKTGLSSVVLDCLIAGS